MNREEIDEKFYELNNSWYNGTWPHQLIINLFEKIDEINIEQETSFHISEQYGAISGEISMLIEVYNPTLETDIKILHQLLEIINFYKDHWRSKYEESIK